MCVCVCVRACVRAVRAPWTGATKPGFVHETNTYADRVTGLTTRARFTELAGSALLERNAAAARPGARGPLPADVHGVDGDYMGAPKYEECRGVPVSVLIVASPFISIRIRNDCHNLSGSRLS
eukprot:COSAG01_NODE_17_length_39991_cov_30.596160_42_plen_123_part_00